MSSSSAVLTCAVLTYVLPVLNLGVWVGAAQAQVTPDVSQGVLLETAEQSMVSSQGSSDRVTGGAIRGSSLFHSFEQLNVAEGRSLYFSPADSITHIFSRVTGNDPSRIDGTLGVLGHADLFLLNPNGVLFGPNAQLDLSGSFSAIAAAGIQFEDFEFSATAPQPVPLLNISTPLGINWGRNPGAIVNRSTANGTGTDVTGSNSTGLAVKPFQTLSLSGGNITLAGGAIAAVDGRIELTSVEDISLTDQAMVLVDGVEGNPESEIELTGQNITLDGQSEVRSQNSSVHPGADITFQAQTLTVGDASQVSAATQGSGTGGNITATTSEAITVTSAEGEGKIGHGSRIVAETSGSGNAGQINLQTGKLRFEYDSSIINQSHAFTTGHPGDITIQASDSVVGQWLSPVTNLGGFIVVQSLGSGHGGSLRLTTPQLTLKEHHAVKNSTWLTGNAGEVWVDADRILLDGVNPEHAYLTSAIQSVTRGEGDGGNIQIKTQDLKVQNSASITTAVLADRDEMILDRPTFPELLPLLGLPNAGLGDAGNIQIVADTIAVDGFNRVAASRPSQISSVSIGVGNAGDVEISTDELSLTQGAVVVSSSLFSFATLGSPLTTSGLGDGGDLRVTADAITVAGVNPLTELPSLLGTQTGSRGNAGNTQIMTGQLTIQDGGAVLSGTYASGNGGKLMVTAQDSITVDGISTQGQPSTLGTFAALPSPNLRRAFFFPDRPDGDTGQLMVHSDRLTITNGGTVSAAHEGIGNAGVLGVDVNQLRLSHGGQLSATSSEGQGGNLNLRVEDLLELHQGSRITAEALGNHGDGGNLAITAGTILAIPDENSDIIANAVGGMGGEVNITTNALLGIQFREQLTPQSDITASSQAKLDGTVRVELLSSDPRSNLAQLPESTQASEQVVADCRPFEGSRFVITGQGGLPPDSRHHLNGMYPLQDWRRSLPENAPMQLSEQNQPEQKQPSVSMPSAPEALPTPPIEATGWQIDAENKVQLVAQSTVLENDKASADKSCAVFR